MESRADLVHEYYYRTVVPCAVMAGWAGGVVGGAVFAAFVGPVLIEGTSWVQHLLFSALGAGLLVAFSEANIYVRQLALPGSILFALHLAFSNQGVQAVLLLAIVIPTLVSMSLLESRMVMGTFRHWWRSLCFHPTDWHREFNGLKTFPHISD